MNRSDKETYKEFYLHKMKRVRSGIREQLAERAADNLVNYYALLRSTGVTGIEEFIKAIDESTFKTAPSNRHHRYTGGTLEHSLGVYKIMKRRAAVLRRRGYEIAESDVILVGLLHDICKGHHPHWHGNGHGGRSREIVSKYLPGLSEEVLYAIERHMHPKMAILFIRSRKDLFLHLIGRADMPDASTCDKGYAKLSDTKTVPLKP